MKYYYKIYGLVLESDYEFHQFANIDKDDVKNVDIRVNYGNIKKDILESIEQKYDFGVYSTGVWFKNQVGIFWIHDKSEINFIENEDISIEDASVFLPGLCLSILLWQRGDIVIHGSCLRYRDKTIIISGNSGAGKSTIATELIKRGAKLIADDVSCLREENGEFVSYPAFPVQKLCADQIEANGLNKEKLKQITYDLNKYEVDRKDEFYDSACKIDYFFRIEKDDVELLKIETITGAEKLKIVLKSIFLDWMFNEAFKFKPEDFIRCTRFSNNINIFKIVRPYEVDTIGALLGFIEKTVERVKE